jgi:hypothetical protein
MHGARAPGWRNPSAWYLAGGLALIAASLWLPWFTAARTARVEQRADRLAELLLCAAEALLVPPVAGDVEHVLARFLALAAADGAFLGDLERVEPPFPDSLLVLTNKHYALQLAASPPPATATPGSDTVPALEVLAWPLSALGPGHSVFFHAENAPRAYTRNLSSRIVGLGNTRPQPGSAQPRETGTSRSALAYRSANDDRWVVF